MLFNTSITSLAFCAVTLKFTVSNFENIQYVVVIIPRGCAAGIRSFPLLSR